MPSIPVAFVCLVALKASVSSVRSIVSFLCLPIPQEIRLVEVSILVRTILRDSLEFSERLSSFPVLSCWECFFGWEVLSPTGIEEIPDNCNRLHPFRFNLDVTGVQELIEFDQMCLDIFGWKDAVEGDPKAIGLTGWRCSELKEATRTQQRLIYLKVEIL
ncbi:hypothetical protein Trydic_g15736 [Trypoxylus dichotomus]